MKDLDSLIENTFKAKRSNKKTQKIDLIALVEATLDEVYDKVILGERETRPTPATKTTTAKEFLLSLPKFSPNESWGDPNSVDRKTVNKIFSVVGGDATIEAKLKFIQRIAEPDNQITSPRRIISTLIILESLSAAINSFSASAAGFVFEGFLSALFRGRQEAEISDKGNLPIQDFIAFSELGGGTPVSLKLLNQTTNIHGSYTNLVDALDEFAAMIYLVARKDGESIALEEFVLDRDNFIDAISTSAGGKRTKEAELFGGSRNIEKINSLSSWPEKFAALQKTPGYRGGKRPATDLEASKDGGDDETGVQASMKKAEEILGYDAGLSPLDYPSSSRAAFNQDKDFWTKWFGPNATANSLNAVMKKKGYDNPAQMKDWAIRSVISQAKESVLTESKGSQWSISPAQLKSLQGVDYKSLGELPYSSDKIEKIAQDHMDKLNDSLLELFEATKALSDNVNNYFTYEKRDDAIKSGETAIKDTVKIQDSLRTEISRKDEI
jgi:hypothetical protein